MHSSGTPPAEIAITESLASGLIRSQHPDLGHLPIHRFGEGWDNALFLLGDELLLRLPRRAMGARLIQHEQTWLPSIASRLPIPVPVPLRAGSPSVHYPWHWSVVPLLPGRTANEAPLNSSQAAILATFLRILHAPAPIDAPRNPVRGVLLRDRQHAVEERIARLRSANLFADRLTEIWHRALHAPPCAVETWLHGDLHERNVLVEDGRLSAVIDWGDVCQGDRATDLAAVWTLFDELSARTAAMSEYGCADEALWLRAKGWAVLLGVTLLDSGLTDNPDHAQMGRSILRRLEEGP